VNKTNYWIWHFGDFEIFHAMQVQLRREEQGYHRPPFWKIHTPYVSVKFRKQIDSNGGYMICHINGSGHVAVDDIRHRENTHIELTPGRHIVEVLVSNYGGIPAIFIESDVCPSDESWTCNHFAGEFAPVSYNEYFDSIDKNPEIFPFEYKRMHPIGKEDYEDGILYDFGRELFGFLNISGVDKNQEIKVFYGESREEALDSDYSYISDCISGQKDYRLRQRAFRYVYLKGLSVKAQISADFEYLPLYNKGSFKCSNPLFNKLYDVAKETFHLNCREAYLDGIKRDRWIWSGDAYQSARINRYLFADKEIDQRTLIGLIGRLPIEQHINTIMDYSLLWIITLYEHYITYGDKRFLKRIFPMANELLHFCESRINNDGFVEGVGDDWTFIDWTKMDKCGAVCAEQMLLIQTYTAMAYFSRELGVGNPNELYYKSEELKAKVNKYYWNEEKGAFIDSYKSGKNNVTRHANIFAIMYDIATEEQVERILKNVLLNDGVEKITTPYFEGYELDVLAKLDMCPQVEDMLESYWGGMLELGAQTIWEEFDPKMQGIQHYAMYGGKYEKSLCHAWGATPIYLFGRYYIGVYPTSPGYETFTVKPNIGGLTDFCGTVPINDASVSVEWNKNQLSVIATKAGGTLVWKNKNYRLVPNVPLVVEL
jgi:hypothetical protein